MVTRGAGLGRLVSLPLRFPVPRHNRTVNRRIGARGGSSPSRRRSPGTMALQRGIRAATAALAGLSTPRLRSPCRTVRRDPGVEALAKPLFVI